MCSAREENEENRFHLKLIQTPTTQSYAIIKRIFFHIFLFALFSTSFFFRMNNTTHNDSKSTRARAGQAAAEKQKKLNNETKIERDEKKENQKKSSLKLFSSVISFQFFYTPEYKKKLVNESVNNSEVTLLN